MYLGTGYRLHLFDSECGQKINKNQKKKLNNKNAFFQTSINVLLPSRPVDGVKKNSSLLGKPVDLAGLTRTLNIYIIL